MIIDSNEKVFSHRITIEYGAFTISDENEVTHTKLIRVCDSVLLGTIGSIESVEPQNLRIYTSYEDGTEADDLGILVWISNILTRTIPVMHSNPIIRGVIESIDTYLTWQLNKIFRDKKPGLDKYHDS